MALTGPQINASIYGLDKGFGLKDFRTGGYGRANTFTNVAELKFYPAPAGTTADGVTMNAVIEQSAGGLNVNTRKYYTDSTVAQIKSNGA
jgi:streptogramin lyase